MASPTQPALRPHLSPLPEGEGTSSLPFAIHPPLPQVRLYRDEDAQAVARFWRESYTVWPGGGIGGGLFGADAMRRDVERSAPQALYLYWAPDEANGGERVVGFCSMFEVRDPTAAYVGTLGAHPGAFRTGVGRDLLKVALARTVELGRKRLDLHTWPGNQRAVPLYKKIGFFWEPDSSVHMLNYLPLIFGLPVAQRFFAGADWYADLRRPVDLYPDEERWRGHDVYRYEWQRDGRRLTVLVDRHSGGLVQVESDDLAVEAHAAEGRLVLGEPAGEARWRVADRSARPRSVGLVAEGRDGLGGSLRWNGTVDGEHDWRLPLTAEKAGRGRVAATLLVDDETFELAPTVEVVEPVAAKLASTPRLTPGVAASTWLTLENALDRPAAGVLRLSAEPGLAIEPGEIAFELPARSKRSWQLRLRSDGPGSYRLRGRAQVDGVERAVDAVDATLHCARIGGLVVEQDGDRLTILTDRLRVELGPHEYWRYPVVQLLDRESGEELAVHACAFDRPIWAHARLATWARRVERELDAVTVVLSVRHGLRPDLVIERIVRVASSGLVELRYRATNTGRDAHRLDVESFSIVGGWSGGSFTKVAVPLASGLVVDDAIGRPGGFPDWGDPSVTDPRRWGESWCARFGGGQVVATVWSAADEIHAYWEQPSVQLELGPIEPGAAAETPPLYLYAGPGDWRAARALWRQLVAPQAEARHPTPRPATQLRLTRVAGVDDALETEVVVESERARPWVGRVRVEVDGREVAGGAVDGVRADAPARLPFRLPLPDSVGARAARVVFDHERSQLVSETALIRAGLAEGNVRVEADGERLRLDNGRLRLTLDPRRLGRIVELLASDAVGRVANQLHAVDGDPIAFGGRFPWLGGIHPVVIAGDPSDYPGRLPKATFEARPVERAGAALTWRGVACTVVEPAPKLEEIGLEVAYLTLSGSNLLAVELRLENRGGAFFDGRLRLDTFLAPGGSYQDALLHVEREGVASPRKRVHGDASIDADDWCAVAAGTGSPAIALIAATPGARIVARDIGLEGAHPRATLAARLPPGESATMVVYLVVAEDVAQARLYRALAQSGGLP